MPPEQARGELENVNERSDVFGLGAVLCAMLTGRPPFLGKDSESTSEMARTGKLSDAHAALASCQAEPGIAELCRKCIAAIPGERYANGHDVAEAVARLRQEAVERARRAEVEKAESEVRKAETLKRLKVKRLTYLAGSIAVISGIAAFGIGWFWQQAEKSHADERAAKFQAEASLANETQAKQDLVTALDGETAAKGRALIAEKAAKASKAETEEANAKLKIVGSGAKNLLAYSEWENNEIALAKNLLSTVPEQDRGWEWHYLKKIADGSKQSLQLKSDYVYLAYTPDGKRIVIANNRDRGLGVKGDPSDSVLVLDAKTLKTIHAFPFGHLGSRIDMSGDGKRVALSQQGFKFGDGTIRIVDIEQGKLIQECRVDAIMGAGCCLNNRGNLAAMSTREQESITWDIEKNIKVAALQGGEKSIPRGFAPKSDLVLSTTEKKVILWDGRTGDAVHSFETSNRPNVANFDPDGSRIIVGDESGICFLWDTTNGRLIKRIADHQSSIIAATFSRDGNRIITSEASGRTIVWSKAGEMEAIIPEKTTLRAGNECASPDGRYIATLTTDRDKTIRIWDIEIKRPLATLKGHQGTVETAVISPDGRWIATVAKDKMLKVWDATRDGISIRLNASATDSDKPIISSEHDRIMTRSNQGIHIWQLSTGKPLLFLRNQDEIEFRGAIWAGDESTLLSLNKKMIVEKVKEPGESGVTTFRSSSTAPAKWNVIRFVDGRYSMNAEGAERINGADNWAYNSTQPFIFLSKGKTISGYVLPSRDLSGFPQYCQFAHPGGNVISLALHDCGILLSSDGRKTCAWDPQTKSILQTVEGPCVRAVYLDQARMIMLVNRDSVSAHRMSDGSKAYELKTTKNEPLVAIDRNGDYLLYTQLDADSKMAYLIHTPTMRRTELAYYNRITRGTISHDGTRCVTGTIDGNLQFWDTRTGALMLILKAHSEPITDVSFIDDHRIYSATQNETRVWSMK